MTISMPLTSSAAKHAVVIQCVTRTMRECGGVVVTGAAGPRVGTAAASAIRESYHFGCTRAPQRELMLRGCYNNSAPPQVVASGSPGTSREHQRVPPLMLDGIRSPTRLSGFDSQPRPEELHGSLHRVRGRRSRQYMALPRINLRFK